MIIVMPSAPTATITVCVKMVLKLWNVRKNSRVSEGIENSAITTMSPRNGPAFATTFLAVSFIYTFTGGNGENGGKLFYRREGRRGCVEHVAHRGIIFRSNR